jgi:hypothetical protein
MAEPTALYVGMFFLSTTQQTSLLLKADSHSGFNSQYSQLAMENSSVDMAKEFDPIQKTLANFYLCC